MTEKTQQTTALDATDSLKPYGKQSQQKTHTHQAVMKLKQTQKHIDTVKRRCMVLKIQDDKNRYKTVDHQRKMKFLESVKEETEKEKHSYLDAILERERIVGRLKQRNHYSKDLNKSRISSMKESIVHEKVNGNRDIRDRSRKNEQLINEMIEEDHLVKHDRKKQIQQRQKEGKYHVVKYYENKIDQTKKQKANQNQQFLNKLKRRQLQLQKLSTLQDVMIKKHAESIQASQVMRNKLRQVLGTSIEGRVSPKLPDINSRMSNYSHSPTIHF